MAWKNKRGVPEVKREQITIDATGKIVGRLATKIAEILVGKDKPTYVPHIDAGAVVIVKNADKLVVSGKKLEQKNIYRSSNRPSGITATKIGVMMQTEPGEVLRHAVKYMLPKNHTQAARLKRLIIA